MKFPLMLITRIVHAILHILTGQIPGEKENEETRKDESQ